MSRRDEAALRASFAEYVALRRPGLLRTAYLLCGDHAAAEDLVQIALMKVVPKWRRIADNPDAYVRRVLVRENISRWRGRRWREVATSTLPDAPARARDDDERLVLQAALTQLAPRQRAVLVLRYYDDLTEAETAKALDITVGTVKSQARDGLARLRALLPEQAPTGRTVGS